MKTVLSLAMTIALAAGGGASAQPVATAPKVVMLPALRAWCGAEVLPQAAAEDQAAVDAARRRLEDALDKALLAAGVAYSGLPFVAAVSREASATPQAGKPPPPVDTLRIEVCSAVSSAVGQSPASPLRLRTFAPAEYAVRECAEIESDTCATALRQSMLSTYGSESRDQVYESPILLTRGAASDAPADIVDAYAAAAERATFTALSLSGSGAAAVTLDNETAPKERPMLLNSNAQILVAGAPTVRRAFAAIKVPAPAAN